MLRRFLAAVLPSTLAFAFSGLYSVVDGLFIGRNVGDVGLAAINFAFPLTVLIQAAGTAIGLGGAVALSFARGKNDPGGQDAAFRHTVLLLAFASALLILLLGGGYEKLLAAFGAFGETFAAAREYARVIVFGAVFQVLATGLVPLLRSYERALAAMLAMVAGFLTNIMLDWLFIMVFSWGMHGAALATVIGQAATLFPCVILLARQFAGTWGKGLTLDFPLSRSMLQTGLSPFGLAVAPYIVLVMMNKAAMVQGGEPAVAAYAVVAYVWSFIQLVLQGVGDGSQPLMSLFLGRGETGAVRRVRRFAYVLALFLALGYLLFSILFRDALASLFGASLDAKDFFSLAMPIFALGFPAIALLRVTSSYLYASRQNRAALCFIYAEPVLVGLLLAVLPGRFGLTGVWLSPLGAQIVLCLAVVALLVRESHYKNNEVST